MYNRNRSIRSRLSKLASRVVGLAAVTIFATAGLATSAHAATDTPPNAHFSVSVKNDGTGFGVVKGWAFDNDNLNAKLHVTFALDGQWLTVTKADQFSGELAPYGIFYSGFGWGANFTGGQHTLCMFVENVGPTPNQGVLTQCETFNVNDASPRGWFTGAFDHDGVGRWMGWAIDESDLTKSLDIILTHNGKIVAYQRASQSSEYLNAYGIPGNHAFAFDIAPENGQWCAFAINIGAGHNTTIGCVDWKG